MSALCPQPGQSVWTDDEIINAIEDIANDPAFGHSIGYNGRKTKVGMRRGVSIKVVIDPTNAEIVTGYPWP